MKDCSFVRFADSVNNHISGPSVANWNLLAIQAKNNMMPETYMVTYKEKNKKLKYPKVKLIEVELKQDKAVSGRMPPQPHFNTLEKALTIADFLKDKVMAVAVSGKYSPQAEQFTSILKSNYKKDCKLVVEGHGSEVCGYQLRNFENLYKNIYKKADLVILMETPFAKLMFELEGFPTDNMAICPTVVSWEDNIKRLKENPEIKDEIKKKYFKKYKIPSDAEFVLTIGRFQKEKRHKDFVIAAKKLLNDSPNLYFLLGGSEEGTINEIKNMVRNEKNIKLIGKVPFSDFFALIANSIAFVIPSIEIWKGEKLLFAETGPRTVVEALASSIIGKNVVIASYSGGTPWKFNMEEWLKNSAKIGAVTPKKPVFENISAKKNANVYNAKNRALLIEQKNPESIAEAIKIILNDEKLRKKLNSEGARYVKEWYDSKRIAMIYNEILKNVG